MPKSGITGAITATVMAVLAFSGASVAREGLGSRLDMDRLGEIQTGAYFAGDRVRFTLAAYAEKFLMRFDGEPEIYVLYADHGSYGGRVLKYDSGGTAMQVSGWGAMTVYTDAQPGGLPAARIGDAEAPVLLPVSLAAMQTAADDEGEHLGYIRGLHISFSADWGKLNADAALRAQAFDALQNAGRGIERFTADAKARAALAAKIDSVRLDTGTRPTIDLKGKTLIVTFSPAAGFAGRASSHGIARALGQMLSVPTPG